MEFKVRFAAEFNRYAIYLEALPLGIKWVDLARKSTGIPDLSLDKINCLVQEIGSNPTICILEETARESGLFLECSEVIVIIKPKALNSYVSIVAETAWDSLTGEIEKVAPKYWIDETRIIEDWKLSGFPKEWNI